jgi:hypothetical protein
MAVRAAPARMIALLSLDINRLHACNPINRLR